MTHALRTWRPTDGFALAGLVLAAVVSCYGVWWYTFATGWQNPEQSHVLLAVPIVLWLTWIRRARLATVTPRWSLWGPGVIAAGWVVGEVGLRYGYDLLWHLGALALVWGAVLSITGPRLLARFLVPVVASLAILPIPGQIRMQIAGPLQDISAVCTQFLLEIAGVPVARTGNVLQINGENVAIAEACNGMRMVAALGVVTYTFAFSIPAKPAVRAMLLAISPLLAVIVNIVRLMPTVLFYGYADAGFADLFHDLSGWLMMVVALGVLWSFMRLLRWMELPVLSYGALRS
ncbi:MAG: exosortase/archaeosortase family protein [Planctomycetota bacterium]